RLLTDRDVDAVDVRVLLVEDRVDQDRRLAGRAVADDQLALPAADVRHRVDRLDAGLQRLLHRLARDHARRLELERPALVRLDRAAPVEWVAERVDDTAEERFADGHVGDVTRAPNRLAFLDLLPLAEERGADVVLLEVEREPDDAVLELEHLHRDAVLEPVDAGDAVADLQDRADLGEIRLDVVLLDPLSQDRGDLFRAQLHVSLSSSRVSVAVVPTVLARSRRRDTSPPAARCRRRDRDRRTASPRPSVPPPARSAQRSRALPRRRARAPSSARRSGAAPRAPSTARTRPRSGRARRCGPCP